MVGFHISLPMGYVDNAPNFALRHRRWQTLQTRQYPKGSRHASTHWKWQPRSERQTTQSHRRPKMTTAGNTSQRSSTPLPWQTLMSTWTTSFQLSMDTPGRGAKCFVTSSTRSSGFSALTSSRTPTVKTPSPKRSWVKKMGPGPPVRQSLGGTLTK